MLAQMRFSTIIHQRVVGAGDVLQRTMGLSVLHSLFAYVLLKVFDYYLPIGWLQWGIGTVFFVALVVKRLAERWFIKLYRQTGRNSRAVTLVGNDPELMTIYEKLALDETRGYRVLGYYADEEIGEWTHSRMDNGRGKKEDGVTMTDDTKFTNAGGKEIKEKPALRHLGTLQDFLRLMREDSEELMLGDEMYVSLSRRDKNIIRKISRFCDHKVIRFFYVPVSVESIGLNLKREMLDDMEIFTTYENPLQNSVNGS